MKNKIIFQSETDMYDIADCIERMQEAVFTKIYSEPIGSEYTITVTRKEEE